MPRRRDDFLDCAAGRVTRRDDAVPFGQVRVVWARSRLFVTGYMSGDSWQVLSGDCLAADAYLDAVWAAADGAVFALGGAHYERALRRWGGQLPSEWDDLETSGRLVEDLDWL